MMDTFRSREITALASQMQAFARTQMFEIPADDPPNGQWENVQDDGWKLEGCIPVYRKPQAGWEEQPNHRKEEIWFIPELFGSDDSVKPDDQKFDKWVLCIWDAQAGRWVMAPKGSATQVHVHFTAPPEGIPGGGSAPCTVISYSDGREIITASDPDGREPNDKVIVENKMTVRKCATKSRPGLATQWDEEDKWYMVEGDDDERRCVTLTNCETGEKQVVTITSSAAVVRGSDGSCWSVEPATNCTGALPFSVSGEVSNCNECAECYTLEDCFNPGSTLQILASTNNNLNVGDVVRYRDFCWKILSRGACTGSPEAPPPTDVQTVESCMACGCYLFTPCDSGPTRTVYRASDDDGTDIDLDSMVGKIVMLDDRLCYTVSLTECSASPDAAVILESVEGCDSCKFWQLKECGTTSGHIYSHTDLSSLTVGDVIRRAEDNKCYEFEGEVARADVPDVNATVDVTVEKKYGSCVDCTTPKYQLDPICPECDTAITDCDVEGGTQVAGSGSVEVTDEDLSSVVGELIKVNGVCYSASEVDNSETVTLDAPLDYSGPFPDCESCQRTCLWIVTDVYDGDTKIGQKKSKIIVDKICEEDDLDVIDIEDC